MILEQIFIIAVFILIVKALSWIFDKPPKPIPYIPPEEITDGELRNFSWILEDNIRTHFLNCEISLRLKEVAEAKAKLLNDNPPSKIYFTSDEDYFNISRIQILDEDYGYISLEIEQIADYLVYYANKEMISSYQLTNLILSFVHEQNIKYSFDEDSTGYREYLRFPIETIFDQTGDCDCKAILSCALFKKLGYRVALALMPGHAALAISSNSDLSFTNFYYNGTYWFYCESTGDSWKPGQLPGFIDQSSIILREV